MKFACLVYHEQKDAVSEAELAAIVAERQDAAAWNEEMRNGGHHVFTRAFNPLGPPRPYEIGTAECTLPTALSRTRRAWAGSHY